ncbi:MotA/TolQ/ExbB proton channel family protein [Methanosphaera sp.]|uniref:MotA/TolQ/ExbB proton channel family protein n=1 Tax=Methanosphaera sp. TaxID=2666342 RepID=UPI0025EF1F81|nr:MotA/TolQ/ExbB proton channel family protein [Methanosphaera sp.]MEE1118247.1 MotA/TolQ/ExbB proton channel family protein [Methanosphaera sp.]MEE3323778.1 MotA/TolQ/ExbB proton channel family protein [Methanosphaera sp.]MEE3418994.1 MotA/TolQ/ExbB proton channel family protein [Methanosphaera sp.]
MDIIGTIFSTGNDFITMFQSGGAIVYLLTIIGLYGLFLAIEKILYLRRASKVDLSEIMIIVNESMAHGGSLEALRAIGNFKTPISRIISEALKIGYRSKSEVEDNMEQVFIVEMGKMMKGLSTLQTIIEVSPLIGLIGTVIGMWYTFKDLGVNSDITLMSNGIYIAIITTIFGLAVAIILLPLYTHIKSMIEIQLDNIEIAKKMSNWRNAEMKVWIEKDIDEVIEALQESPGIIQVKQIKDEQANLKIYLKPNMLEKGIKTIIREKSDTQNRIVESKLKQ